MMMTVDDMNPNELRDAWRERGPKVEGIRMTLARTGEIMWKLGGHRLVVFLRAHEWRAKRLDGKAVAWEKSQVASAPLASFEDLERLVIEMQVDDARGLAERFLVELGLEDPSEHASLMTDGEHARLLGWARARMDEGAARARAYLGPEEGAAIVDLRKALGWPVERSFWVFMLARETQKVAAVVHSCGPSTTTCSCSCVEDGPCEHEWDGPVQNSEDGLTSSRTCSRCGMPAIEHDMWVLP